MSDSTVVAYVADGELLCVACAESGSPSATDQLTEAVAYVEYGDTGAECSECGACIVSPPEPEYYYEEYDYELDSDSDYVLGDSEGGDLETD
jgi:hypothetical protein